MAIKGKKKSRGSQARRRPSTAPRPVAAARRKDPWYHTTTGRLIAGSILAVIAGLVIWAVMAAQSRSEDLAAEQDRLVDYTSEIRSILQLVRVPASEMTQAPTSAEDGIGSLEKDVVTWLSALTNAQQQIQGVAAPPGMDSINAAFLQSINTYAGAGRTYELALKVDGDVVEEVLARASEQREQAGSQWQLATDLLDEERADADMSASDLPVPAEAIPGAAPSGSEGGENN